MNVTLKYKTPIPQIHSKCYSCVNYDSDAERPSCTEFEKDDFDLDSDFPF